MEELTPPIILVRSNSCSGWFLWEPWLHSCCHFHGWYPHWWWWDVLRDPTYYLLPWHLTGFTELLGRRAELFNFIRDSCGVAADSKHGDCRVALLWQCWALGESVCFLSESSKTTTPNAGKQIWESFLAVGNVASVQCRYSKLAERFHIDKSLSFQESSRAKIALGPVLTETLPILLQYHW